MFFVLFFFFFCFFFFCGFFFFFFFLFGYQVDAFERAIQKVREIFLKLWRYGTGTFTLI